MSWYSVVRMQQRIIITGALVLCVVLIGGLWYMGLRLKAIDLPSSGLGTTTTSPEAASSTSVTGLDHTGSTVRATLAAFPISPLDTPVSWSFNGTDALNAALTAATDADRAKLTTLLGKGQYDDYDLYIGLGNDANQEGDGRSAYTSYNKAAAIHPNKGLAYANLGNLFDELGAYHTAAAAYAKSVAVEPRELQYHLSQLEFLVNHFPTDNARLTAAFADAHTQFGDSANILAIEAQWFEAQGRYAEAITVWQTVKALSPADRQAAIEVQIARDQVKA